MILAFRSYREPRPITRGGGGRRGHDDDADQRQMGSAESQSVARSSVQHADRQTDPRQTDKKTVRVARGNREGLTLLVDGERTQKKVVVRLGCSYSSTVVVGRVVLFSGATADAIVSTAALLWATNDGGKMPLLSLSWQRRPNGGAPDWWASLTDGVQ